MEGSAFAKRIRDVRAEAERQAALELEERIPAPPTISASELEAAAPVFVAALEHEVAERIRKLPSSTFVRIALDDAEKHTHTVPRLSLFPTLGWWADLNLWANEHRPTCPVETERYNKLLRRCLKVLRNVWNDAHPGYAANVDRDDHALEIVVPKK